MKSVTQGRLAEDLAAHYLEQLGYHIIHRNYRCKNGEVDLIAQENGVLCFVEVRSRTHIDLMDPFETITPKKIRRIVYASRHFLANVSLPWPKEMRFDAVGVVLKDPPDIELLRAAFEA